MYFDRLGYPQQCINRNCFYSAFNGADVHGMERGFFGELLLAHAGLLSAGADVVTENAPLFLDDGHQ